MEPAELKAIEASIEAIVEHLVDEAIWHEDRCTWVGGRYDSAGVPYDATLESSLYEGTSGVALFLAECDAAREDRSRRETALGAIRHALHRAETEPSGPGLYVGDGGVAVAAARVGRLLGDDGVRERARYLAPRIEAETEDRDLLSGTAGSIVAMLALSGEFDDPELTVSAAALGDTLLDPRSGKLELTGAAHGLAGAGFALAQLYAITDEERFKRGAIAVFDEEQRLFDPSTRNWPDLRSKSRGSMAAWCHGGPGIALTRLTAYELLRDERYLTEASIGLEAARDALLRPAVDYSYCHGVSGNAEVVREVSICLQVEGERLVNDVMLEGVERFGPDASWPCGTRGRTSPGLMLGLAGIGHFLLVLTEKKVPSVLRMNGVANRC